MRSFDNTTEEFKSKYERFLIGCDALEELGQWNKDDFGEMDVFYQNDLVSVILRLIAVDGKISDEEVKYLNANFGFEFTLEDLIAVYECCRDEIGRSFNEQFKKGFSLLQSINEKLADAYKELLCLICDIIISSDNVVTPEVIKEAASLKRLVI